MLIDRFTVTVASRTRLLVNASFRDEARARSFYADCLLKYPACSVEIISPPTEQWKQVR